MKIAFVTNKVEKCGVAQFGRDTFQALREHSRHEAEAFFLEGRKDFKNNFEAIASADVAVYNYHPLTLPFLKPEDILSSDNPAIGLLHEFDYLTAHGVAADIFRYRIVPDPSFVSPLPGLWAAPRIVPQTPVVHNRNDLPTIGSFGLATPGKNFEEILKFAESHFEKARVRINISDAHYAATDIRSALLDFYHNRIDPRIELSLTHDFMPAEEMVKFLAGNDLNLFLYDDAPNRGISSTVDWALAAERPLALSDSSMFRHLRYFAPELFLANSNLPRLLETGRPASQRLKKLWTPENAARSYDDIFDQVAEDWRKPHAARFNTVLTDDLREGLAGQEAEIAELCPEMFARKIKRANVQQAFVKALVEKKARPGSRILCVGRHEDTAYHSLAAKGWAIEAIDPVYDLDLNGFYALHRGKRYYDVIFSTSVLEHVPDDETFMSQMADLLAPGGLAILTVDFKNAYSPGQPLPPTDCRLYTALDIMGRLAPLLRNCRLLDAPDWLEYGPDFALGEHYYGFATLVFQKNESPPEALNAVFTEGLNRLLGFSKAQTAGAPEKAAEREYYRHQLSLIENSRSWRLTRPLRAAAAPLKIFIARAKALARDNGPARIKAKIKAGLKKNRLVYALYRRYRAYALRRNEHPVAPPQLWPPPPEIDIFGAPPAVSPREKGRRVIYCALGPPTSGALKNQAAFIDALRKNGEITRLVRLSPQGDGSAADRLEAEAPLLPGAPGEAPQNGPPEKLAATAIEPGDWFLKLSGPDEPDQAERLIYAARGLGLRTAFYFAGSPKNEKYRRTLLLADLVLCGDSAALEALREFWTFHERADGLTRPRLARLGADTRAEGSENGSAAQALSALLTEEDDIRRRPAGDIYCLWSVDGAPLPPPNRRRAPAALAASGARLFLGDWHNGRLRAAGEAALKEAGLSEPEGAVWPAPGEEAWIIALSSAPGLSGETVEGIVDFGERNKIFTAFVLEEETPESVLAALTRAKKIFPVSRKAKAQFIKFLLKSRLPCPCLERRLETCRWDQGPAPAMAEILARLAEENRPSPPQPAATAGDAAKFYRASPGLKPRPALSICISTYNRSRWLGLSLANLARLWPDAVPEVEILVCDNASTDQTGRVVKPYLGRSDFRYVRNAQNVGMLGNLRVTAQEARGGHIWILGDDDLLFAGTIRHVLDVLQSRPGTPLIYPNYSYTMSKNIPSLDELGPVIEQAYQVSRPTEDRYGPFLEIAANNYNFFTAIYALIFRRDHALRAYSQPTGARPFSCLAASVPTTLYALERLGRERIYWLGRPQLMVNGNVSYGQYLPLHYLERVPEYMDRFEYLGVKPELMAPHWADLCPGLTYFWAEMFERTDTDNALYFSAPRLMLRLRSIPALDAHIPALRRIYEKAHAQGHPAAKIHPDALFAAWAETPPAAPFPEPC